MGEGVETGIKFMAIIIGLLMLIVLGYLLAKALTGPLEATLARALE